MENNDWDKGFEEKYWPHNEDNDWGIDVSTFYEIKSFIRETRLSAFQEGLEEALKTVRYDWAEVEMKIEGVEMDFTAAIAINNFAEKLKAITSCIE